MSGLGLKECIDIWVDSDGGFDSVWSGDGKCWVVTVTVVVVVARCCCCGGRDGGGSGGGGGKEVLNLVPLLIDFWWCWTWVGDILKNKGKEFF